MGILARRGVLQGPIEPYGVGQECPTYNDSRPLTTDRRPLLSSEALEPAEVADIRYFPILRNTRMGPLHRISSTHRKLTIQRVITAQAAPG